MNIADKSKMRQRVYLYGAPFYVSKQINNFNDKYKATGNNTGNLLIGDGLVRIIDANIVPAGSVKSFDEIDGSADLIAIPAANFLSPGIDISWLLPVLEKSTLPVMMMGVGAQFPRGLVENASLPATSLRVMKIISERSNKIGVRGSFTAELLNKYGIKNVEITGCPSIFRDGKANIKINKKIYKPENIVFNGSSNVTGHSSSPDVAKNVESKLFDLAMQFNSPYVLQNELHEMRLSLNGDESEIDNCSRTLNAINSKMDKYKYINYIKQKSKVFFDLNEWKNFIGNHDVSIGSRFHGNMMALSQGIASIFVVHDSRTKELCETLKIPYVTMNEFLEKSLEEIFNDLDYSSFEKNYPMHVVKVGKFLSENGINNFLTNNFMNFPNDNLIKIIDYDNKMFDLKSNRN